MPLLLQRRKGLPGHSELPLRHNFDSGRVERSIYTGETIEISEEFFLGMERQILGKDVDPHTARTFRKETQHQYASKTLTQEIMVEGLPLTGTAVYKSLLERYVHNLKEKVMDPFQKNDNFRRAIKDFGAETFRTYDKRIKDEVTFLMKNLQKKYLYSPKGRERSASTWWITISQGNSPPPVEQAGLFSATHSALFLRV